MGVLVIGSFQASQMSVHDNYDTYRLGTVPIDRTYVDNDNIHTHVEMRWTFPTAGKSPTVLAWE